MKEELIKESEPRMLAVSAGAAVLVHALVFFSFAKISMEQNAYAIGNRGSIEMILTAPAAPEAVVEAPKIAPPPEPIKVPTEFKKQVVHKPIEKKIVKEVPPAPVEKAATDSSASLNQDVANRVVGETNGNTTQGNSRAEPDYLTNPPPRYPNESRRRHEEGVVLIQAAINSFGKVDNLKLFKGSGFERLDEAAMTAVKDWKFKPAKFAGIAIDSNVEIPVRFSLR